jgi:DNA-binding IclR family transcriptional regulator
VRERDLDTGGEPETLQTADAALAVLEHLAGARRPQGLAEISRSLAISKPKAHRILRTLRARGYATQDADTSQYGFGLACARLAAQAAVEVDVKMLCAPALRWLWESTQETAYLAAREGSEGVVIEKMDGPQPVIATCALGRSLPLHAASAGKVLLAGLSDGEVGQLMSPGLTRYTASTPADLQILQHEIARVRREGHATNREGYRDGVSGVAAPVRWSPGGPTALAIAVCVPSVRFGRAAAALREAVIEAGARASRALEAAAHGSGPPGRGREEEEARDANGD